jgi:hypothetical protein
MLLCIVVFCDTPPPGLDSEHRHYAQQTATPWLHAVVRYRNVWRKSNFAQDKGVPLAIQIPTHWNPIGRRLTAPLPVLSPSSILPQRSSHCAFIRARQNLEGVPKKKLLLQLYLLLKLRKCEVAQLWCYRRRGMSALPLPTGYQQPHVKKVTGLPPTRLHDVTTHKTTIWIFTETNISNFLLPHLFFSRSQWPHGIRRRSAAERLLGLRVRIPLGAWTFVSCECLCCQVEVSATGRSLVHRSPTDSGVCLSVTN